MKPVQRLSVQPGTRPRGWNEKLRHSDITLIPDRLKTVPFLISNEMRRTFPCSIEIFPCSGRQGSWPATQCSTELFSCATNRKHAIFANLPCIFRCSQGIGHRHLL